MDLKITLDEKQCADVASSYLKKKLLKLLQGDLAKLDINMSDYDIKLVEQNIVLEYVGLDADVVGESMDTIIRNAREREIAIFTCLDLTKV